MLPEIEKFQKWLRRKAPHSRTPIDYTSDLTLFFAWAGKLPGEITLHDVDEYIEHCQGQGHAGATINRRLAALRSLYHFLAVESANAPANPVLPRRHFVRLGTRLPRDAQDDAIRRLFAVIENPRDRAMFLLMLRCGE
jgi:site-specific recombinase XerD